MNHLQRWLRIDADAKLRTYREGYETAELRELSYWLGILFSAGIATLGLVLNSPAVIIGAMLISPLMNPIMATGLGLATGDLYLAFKALIKLLLSILVAVALSAVLVWTLPFHSITNEILSRINPTLLDLGVALLSGLAGSVAVTRSNSGEGVTTLPGVAIAVALMPPLCTVGFGIGSGWSWSIIGGASLLFLTNLVAIVFSAFLIFLLTGMNTSEVRHAIAERRSHEPVAGAGRLSRLFSIAGPLHWRIIVLVSLLLLIAFPLQKALRQLAREAIARDAVQQVVSKILPRNDVVSSQTEVGPTTVAVRIVATRSLSDSARQAAEAEISHRSHLAASLTVQSIASQSELGRLVERINATQAAAAAAPPPAPPPPSTLTQDGDEIRKRVSAALTAVWPPQPPVDSYNLTFSQTGPQLNVVYAAPRDIDALSLDLLQTALRKQLASPALTLTLTRNPPTRSRTASRR